MDFKNSSQVLNLFSTCIPVKGASRSIICDLDRFAFEFIPNSLYEIIDTCCGKEFRQIYDEFGDENHEILDDYFNLLLKKEFIFSSAVSHLFPKIGFLWEIPALLDNAIIDVDKNSNHDYDLIIKQLVDLGCKSIQFRFFDEIDYVHLERALLSIEKTIVRSVEIVLPYTSEFYANRISICEKFPRITNLMFHSSPIFHLQEFSSNSLLKIIQVKDRITNENHCGVVYPEMFAYGAVFHSEALKYNTCLNHKLSIDKRGEIKNCPSMKASFGNVKDVKLLDALNADGFKLLWKVNKDKIRVCKDCEFRYICTDCRAYIDQPEDEFSKPLKCGYDPYSCEWEEWSTHPHKQQAIEHYSLRGLINEQVLE